MKKSLKKNKKILLTTTITFIILDRVSKEIIHYLSKNGEINFKFITYLTNTGTLFGLFKGNNIFFITLTIIILAFLYYSRKEFLNSKTKSALTGLITAGAIGNLYDRLVYGRVIDFINLQVWPAFNIADTCITIGIIGLIICFWKEK